jgi:phosphatidylserine/phosphatidylglycerophosphate/cardiolipin synthase-like enzyme
MSEERDALVEAIAALARALPDETIARACEALRETATAEDAVRILERLITAPPARVRVQRTAQAWLRAPGVSPGSVALALECAGRLDSSYRSGQRLELVWTGPTPSGTILRRSDQIMLDLVRHSCHTLTIVSFAAYRVASVHAALLDAAQRGVKIRFILESREESGGRVNMDPRASMSRELASRSELYVWPFDQRPTGDRDRVGVLHAKCALSDERRLFVSSANFTGAALSLNMELGLLIEDGEMPRQVQEHFDQLIMTRVLRRVGDDH